MITTVLFDVDGTLLDTTEYIYQAFEHSLQKHHQPLTRDHIGSIMGKPLDESYQILTQNESVEHYAQAHHEYQNEHPHLSFAFPNATNTLQKLKDRKYHIAAVTTRRRNTVLETLEIARILPFLEHIVAYDDVENPKPHPEPILKALDFLGVSPQNAIMVGDSPVDILAGKNAGTKTVGVTYGFHGPQIAELGPDYVIDDIGDILAYL